MYLQVLIRWLLFIAGGGIVYDSVEEDEYQETMNKMGSNLATLEQCERKIWEQQQQE